MIGVFASHLAWLILGAPMDQAMFINDSQPPQRCSIATLIN